MQLYEINEYSASRKGLPPTPNPSPPGGGGAEAPCQSDQTSGSPLKYDLFMQ